MARKPNRDDSLLPIRKLLRGARSTPAGVTPVQSTAALDAVEAALFRLPVRRREIVRRYDLRGEPATEIQRALALSARQFFRDRRAALCALNTFLFGEPVQPAEAISFKPVPQRPHAVVDEPAGVAQTLARNLSQSGNPECLEILRELATQAREPALRAEALLDLADAALDHDRESLAGDAIRVGALELRDAAEIQTDRAEQLLGRLSAVQAQLADTVSEASAHFARAIPLLRSSLDADRTSAERGFALVAALGRLTLLHFGRGAFAQACITCSEASDLIERLRLWTRPQALEIAAMNAVLGALLSGRAGLAVQTVAGLLGRAIDSGWCSTTARLGADLVGLSALRGDYPGAIRWHRRITAMPAEAMRPLERFSLSVEAAHAYTMSGRAAKALSLLGYVKPGAGCPRPEEASWHVSAAWALERLGNNAAALDEANRALTGYAAQQVPRGAGDAHRVIASAQAHLGNTRAAREHIEEAQRLTESHGTSYALLRTLTTKAEIINCPRLRSEAAEFARVLARLGELPSA